MAPTRSSGANESGIGAAVLASSSAAFAYPPLAPQPKLLGVLQEQEFQKLGNGHMVRIAARVWLPPISP